MHRDGTMHTFQDDTVALKGDEELDRYYVVRLIKVTCGTKSCVAEEEFEQKPTHNQILWCLKKHSDADFASVVENYRIVKSESPF